MIIKKKYLSTTEAGDLLGISRVAVLKRIKKGTLPAIRVGRNYAILLSDILGETGDRLKTSEKKEINLAVKRVVQEYGEALKKLGET